MFFVVVAFQSHIKSGLYFLSPLKEKKLKLSHIGW